MSEPLWFWPTAYGWEVLFLLMAFIGFIASMFGVIDAWKARQDLWREGINGERMYQAFQHLFEEVTRSTALGIMVYGGIFITNSSPPAAPQTVFVLNSVALILNMKALQDYRFRKDIREGRWTRGHP